MTHLATKYGTVFNNQTKKKVDYTIDIAVLRGDIKTYGKELVSDASLFFQKMLKLTYDDTRNEILDKIE